MTPRIAYRRAAPIAAAFLSITASCICLAATDADGRPIARAPRSSQYPAGATRATLHARASELARPDASVSSLGGAAAPSSSPPPKKAPKKPTLHGDPARALLGFEAMQKHYYILGSGLYEGEPFSFLWPFSQALAATVSMAYIPHLGISLGQELQARLIGLNDYLDTDNSGDSEGTYTSSLAAFDGTVAPPNGPGGAKYYDDNDWVGIELVRMYELTHDTSVLSSAEGIMAFEMAGWETTPELACPGGLPFSNTAENTDRNTVTTAPAAELAVQLYRVTGNPGYLTFAEMAYEWVRRCLLQPSAMYADHLNAQGVVEPTLWSYNQGSMVGAGTLLYEATRNATYLGEARQTAQAALAYFSPSRLGSENPFFVSVYLRNLMYLQSVTHETAAKRLAQGFVDYAWGHERLSDDLFVSGSPPSGELLRQAAIVQIYALLSISPSSYF